MEQARGLAAHGIFKIAKMRQRCLDEGIQRCQRFNAIDGPSHAGCLRIHQNCSRRTVVTKSTGTVVMQGRVTSTGSARGFPAKACGCRDRSSIATFWLAIGIHQQPKSTTHVAIKVFHQPLFTPTKQLSYFVSGRSESAAADLIRCERLLLCPKFVIGRAGATVRLLPGQMFGTVMPHQSRQVVGSAIACCSGHPAPHSEPMPCYAQLSPKSRMAARWPGFWLWCST